MMHAVRQAERERGCPEALGVRLTSVPAGMQQLLLHVQHALVAFRQQYVRLIRGRT